MRQVEMVMSGLLYGGENRMKGDVFMVDSDSFKSIDEQEEQYGKIFYVEVGSPDDQPRMKQMLGMQERNLYLTDHNTIRPSVTDEGKKLMGMVEENVSMAQAIRNKQPDPYVPQEATQEPPEASAATDDTDTGIEESEVVEDAVEEVAEELTEDTPKERKKTRKKK